MLSQALAEPVILRPGKPKNMLNGRGKIPNVERAEIIWRDEVEPGYGVTRPFDSDVDSGNYRDGQHPFAPGK